MLKFTENFLLEEKLKRPLASVKVRLWAKTRTQNWLSKLSVKSNYDLVGNMSSYFYVKARKSGFVDWTWESACLKQPLLTSKEAFLAMTYKNIVSLGYQSSSFGQQNRSFWFWHTQNFSDDHIKNLI